MHRSYNEISVMVKRAALGAGLDYGLAEDVGYAAHWLCEQDLDGVAIAAASISNTAENCRYHEGVFTDARAAIAGPSALDLAMTGRRVQLNGLDQPLLLAGLAGVAANAAAVCFRLHMPGGGEVAISPDRPVPGLEDLRDVADIALSVEKLDGAVLRASVRDSAGADVDAATWKRVEVLAAKTYVPESAASRTRGAGAGLTDND